MDDRDLLGNIRKNSVSELLKSEKFAKFMHGSVNIKTDFRTVYSAKKGVRSDKYLMTVTYDTHDPWFENRLCQDFIIYHKIK